MEEGNGKVPMIVHVSLSKHPLISCLSDSDSFKFKIILSDRTPIHSILFPSIRCSFLIVEVSKMNETTMKETCESFIRNNMDPFILVSSGYSSEPINKPLSSIEIVLSEANKLNIRVNNTMHELYFDQVVIFWIKYNEAPAELYLIQNITTRSKYNECTYYLF